MTRDRLSALKAEVKEFPHDSDEDQENGEAVALRKPVPSFMEDFFIQVENIRCMINDTTAKVSEVKKLHSSILNSTVTEDTDKMKKELERLMGGITSSSHAVRLKLKDIEQRIAEDEKAHFTNADLRIRKTQHATLSRKLIDMMTDYNECQLHYRRQCKDRIQRQLKITNNKAVTDDEIEDMLEGGDLSVFTQGIIIQTQQTKQLLKDIEDRHDDIIKLEKSIQELRDMFVDISILVESQGEMINNIEYNIDQTQNYIESAKEQTHKAVEYQKKARKKKIFIILCIVLSVLILVLILGLSIGLG